MESLVQRYPWLVEVNPQRDAGGAITNCVMSAFAFVLSEREGRSFEAPHTEPLLGVDLVNFHRESLGLGDDEHQVSRIADFASAASVLGAAGPGAMALIAVGGGDEINHVYVGVVDERGVSFVDPQRGTLAVDPTNATALAMLPLTQGIGLPDGARLLSADEVASMTERPFGSGLGRSGSAPPDVAAEGFDDALEYFGPAGVSDAVAGSVREGDEVAPPQYEQQAAPLSPAQSGEELPAYADIGDRPPRYRRPPGFQEFVSSVHSALASEFGELANYVGNRIERSYDTLGLGQQALPGEGTPERGVLEEMLSREVGEHLREFGSMVVRVRDRLQTERGHRLPTDVVEHAVARVYYGSRLSEQTLPGEGAPERGVFEQTLSREVGGHLRGLEAMVARVQESLQAESGAKLPNDVEHRIARIYDELMSQGARPGAELEQRLRRRVRNHVLQLQETVGRVRYRLQTAGGVELPEDVDDRIGRAFDDAFAQLPGELRRNYERSGWSPTLWREVDYRVREELGRAGGRVAPFDSPPRDVGGSAGLPPKHKLLDHIHRRLERAFLQLPDDVDDWIAMAYERLPEPKRAERSSRLESGYAAVRDRLVQLGIPTNPSYKDALRPVDFNKTVARVDSRLRDSLLRRDAEWGTADIEAAYEHAYWKIPADVRANYLKSGWSRTVDKQVEFEVRRLVALQDPVGWERFQTVWRGRGEPLDVGGAAGLPPKDVDSLARRIRTKLLKTFNDLPPDIDDWILIAYEELPEPLRRGHANGFTAGAEGQILKMVGAALKQLEVSRVPTLGQRVRKVASAFHLGGKRFGAVPVEPVGPVLPSGHTSESLVQRYPWLVEVNPQRDVGGAITNCVMSAFAFVLSEREGRSFEAPHTEPLLGVDLVNFHRESLGLGDDEHQVSRIADFASAASVLGAAGPGAMALIAVGGGDEINHVYVGVVDERGVSFVDPQRGTLAVDPTNATALAMLPLTQGIGLPDGARLLSADEVASMTERPFGSQEPMNPPGEDSDGPRRSGPVQGAPSVSRSPRVIRRQPGYRDLRSASLVPHDEDESSPSDDGHLGSGGSDDRLMTELPDRHSDFDRWRTQGVPEAGSEVSGPARTAASSDGGSRSAEHLESRGTHEDARASDALVQALVERARVVELERERSGRGPVAEDRFGPDPFGLRDRDASLTPQLLQTVRLASEPTDRLGGYFR
ncbi:hypothetical protein, partial [Mycobacterium sp. 1482292.6]|uniref:hypothetical protein n=1 Tax=Mycobacterium sp. 1482292.6 TaxID=1834081 RepID=UPI001E4C725B